MLVASVWLKVDKCNDFSSTQTMSMSNSLTMTIKHFCLKIKAKSQMPDKTNTVFQSQIRLNGSVV